MPRTGSARGIAEQNGIERSKSEWIIIIPGTLLVRIQVRSMAWRSGLRKRLSAAEALFDVIGDHSLEILGDLRAAKRPRLLPVNENRCGGAFAGARQAKCRCRHVWIHRGR
jgi:hypothetical protein